VPRRRCVGCGRVAPKTELLRLAMSDQRSAGENGDRLPRVVLDRAVAMPGRGAYLCRAGAPGKPATDCVALATRRGGLARALRCAVKIDPELLESVSR
jgi:predicted RNA-binding protein YlxR (DUF448 family)